MFCLYWLSHLSSPPLISRPTEIDTDSFVTMFTGPAVPVDLLRL